MSERGEVEVLLPVSRWPRNRGEMKPVMQAALTEARQLVAPTGGRVLGVAGLTRAEALDGDLAFKVRFAVEAPEANFTRPKLYTFR